MLLCALCQNRQRRLPSVHRAEDIEMGRSFENRKSSILKTAGQKSKLYSKYGKQLYVAAKNGVPDPEANPELTQSDR